jgi:hypothetical protein
MSESEENAGVTSRLAAYWSPCAKGQSCSRRRCGWARNLRTIGQPRAGVNFPTYEPAIPKLNGWNRPPRYIQRLETGNCRMRRSGSGEKPFTGFRFRLSKSPPRPMAYLIFWQVRSSSILRDGSPQFERAEGVRSEFRPLGSERVH